VPHQDPVLVDERHHVGHGGQRHVVEQVHRELLGQAQRRHQRLHQLERDARAAEVA
jgi:hypothetical protein